MKDAMFTNGDYVDSLYVAAAQGSLYDVDELERARNDVAWSTTRIMVEQRKAAIRNSHMRYLSGALV